MRNLQTDTLEDIRRHKDKLLKLASFYSQSDFLCFTDAISRLEPSSSELEKFEAIEKDINKTADFISKASKLLSTTNPEGIIMEAKGQPNVSDIFKSNYSSSTNSITLGVIEVSIGDQMTKDEAKNMLMSGIFGISSNEFATTKKQTKKFYTINKNDISSKEDAIMYLAEFPLRNSHLPILNKINTIKSDAESVRTNYIDKSKANKYDSLNLIDRQITGSRAMIDSITKASTHVSKSEIHQQSSRHSNEDLQLLHDAIKGNKYISDVEIDPDADVLKVVNLINQVKDLKLNLANDFTLKVRKLGNYKAAGLCMPSQNIVSVNIDRPSSLIHELTHLVDLTNETIKGSDQRSVLITKFRGKLNLDQHAGNQGYLSSDAEIIARLGEVSYILNKFDYNGGNFDDFVSKTQKLEHNDESMCTVKNISTYMKNSDIYFGFGKDDILNEKDLFEIKNYYQTHWGIDKDFISETQIFTQEEKQKYSKRPSQRNQNKSFTPTSFSNITDSSVIDSYEAAKTEDVMNPTEFSKEILINMRNLYRSKKRIKGEEVHRQFRTVDNLFRHILENCSPEEKHNALLSLSEYTGSYYLGGISVLERFLENLPLKQAKKLYSDMTYTNSEGIEYTNNDKKDATDYLNDYGQRAARKMTSLLTCDFIKDIDSTSFNATLDDLQPNTKAFYELVLIRQYLATDEQNVDLKSHLKSRGWLSLFKFDRVDLLAKRLESRYRSLMTVSDAALYPQEKPIISDAFKTLLSEFREYRGSEVSVIDLYQLDNISQLIDEEITQQMKANHIDEVDHKGNKRKPDLVLALSGLVKGNYLKEIGNKVDLGSSSWPINRASSAKDNKPTAITNPASLSSQ